MRSLVLFDIDATLLKTNGAGMAAMEDAGRELFGNGFSAKGIDFAGRLDPLLFREMMAGRGIAPSAEAERQFRAKYATHLSRRLEGGGAARALPGAIELVDAVRGKGAQATGLLTGNFEETAAMKLRACGMDPAWFEVCAWGDDSAHDPPDREHLPPVAMRRFRERYGMNIDPRSITIIGDTIHDVRCARANGCRSIGVATGKYTLSELKASGADHVVADLRITSELMAMLE